MLIKAIILIIISIVCSVWISLYNARKLSKAYRDISKYSKTATASSLYNLLKQCSSYCVAVTFILLIATMACLALHRRLVNQPLWGIHYILPVASSLLFAVIISLPFKRLCKMHEVQMIPKSLFYLGLFWGFNINFSFFNLMFLIRNLIIGLY